jgi:hypothetical protein
MKAVFIFLFSIFAYADISNQTLIGQWKVTHFVTAMPVSELNQNQIDGLIGKILVINSQVISFKENMLDSYEESCPIDNGNSGWVKNNPVDYFDNNFDAYFDAADYQSLGLQVPFWAMNTGCILVFTKGSHKIVFTFGGNFFEATKISNS